MDVNAVTLADPVWAELLLEGCLRFLLPFFFDFLFNFLLSLLLFAAGLLVFPLSVASWVVNAERVVQGLKTFTLSLCFSSSHWRTMSEAIERTVYL